MADAAWGPRQIGQIRVQVTDIDRAVAFYRDVLGMAFIFQFPGMAFFDLDGIRLMVVEPEGRGFGGESAIHELWMAFFRDPDGNVLALMSEVPTA